MHNPGTVPDSTLAKSGPDVTAVFEESYARYRSETLQRELALHHYDRSRCSYIMHSVPVPEVRRVVHELRVRAAYLFVTDLRRNYYNSFGSSWKNFVEAMRTE